MEKNKKYKGLLLNTIIFAIGSFGSKLITFLLVPLYTNILTKPEYGTADLISSISAILVPVAGLVIHDSLLRFGLSRNVNKGSALKSSLILFIPGCLFCLLTTPFFFFYSATKEWAWYIFAISVSTMFYNIVFTYAKVKEKNKAYSMGSIAVAFVLAISNIVFLVFFRFGIKGYLLANVLSLIIPSLVLFLIIGGPKDLFHSPSDRLLMRKMVIFSLPLIVNNLSWWILSSSDKVMIEYFLSSSELGLYTAASKIPSLISVITMIFSSAWTISSIKEYDEDKDKIFFSNVFHYFYVFLFTGAFLVLLILKPFMYFYVGKAFFESWVFVPFLLIGTVFFSIGSFFGSIYGALKKNIASTITTLIAGSINIALNFWLIPIIGVVGASLSTLVSYFVIGIARMAHCRKYFSFYINYVQFAVNSILSLLTCALMYLNVVETTRIVFVIFFAFLIVNFKDFKGMFLFVGNLLKKRRNITKND